MKKTKKSKKKNLSRTPPLSTIDKCVYFVLFVSLIFLFSLYVYGLYDLRQFLAFRDPNMLASSEHWDFLFCLPFMMFVTISVGVFLSAHYGNRTPIFGNAKIKYGEQPWAKDCFPLFDPRRKKGTVRPSAKKRRKTLIAVWCAVAFLLLLLVPFGLFGRDCLYRDLSVNSFNTVNRIEGRTYTQEKFAHLTVQTNFSSNYRSFYRKWRYEVGIEMSDGKVFWFSSKDFDRRDENRKDTALKTMLEIKSRFSPDQITVKGAEDVDRVAEYLSLNEEQTRLLYELFSLN